MGAFAYVVFAGVATFFFGDWGFFLVTGVVVALLLPPYLHEHRLHKQARKNRVLYRPLPQRVPGHASPTRLEAEVLASFILGVSAVIMLVVGLAARLTASYGQYSNVGLWVAGLVLSWVAIVALEALFMARRAAYDPYDPYDPTGPLF